MPDNVTVMTPAFGKPYDDSSKKDQLTKFPNISGVSNSEQIGNPSNFSLGSASNKENSFLAPVAK